MQVTLANLEQATAQDVFTQVATHLLTQNAKSYSETGDCLYRGLNNTKCAAGCLIADDEYKPEMDCSVQTNKYSLPTAGTTWPSLITRGLIPTTVHRDLIISLQSIHDTSNIDDWKWQLEIIAKNHDVTMPVLP